VGPDGRTWATLTPAAYSAALRAQLGSLPGLRWDAHSKAYKAPREALPQVLTLLRASRVAAIEGDVPPVELPHVAVPVDGLRPYQADGACRLAQLAVLYGGALLADEQGIGKTAQAIRAAEVLALGGRAAGRGHVLVLCPAVVVPHWIGQVERWSWQHTATAARWEPGCTADFRVISYDKARRRVDDLQGATVIVCDEMHYLANSRSLRSKAVRKLLEVSSPRPIVLGLTGTPIFSSPRDLHNPLDLLTPGRWGTWWQFTHRYCDGRFEQIPGMDRSVWRADGVSHQRELHDRLQAIMIRRTKADVAVDLPPRVRTILPVDMPKAAVKALSRAAVSVTAGNDVARILGQVEAYKLAAAVELVESLGEGSRVLLVTTRRDTAHELAGKLGCPCVTGEDDAKDRRATIVGSRVAVATMFSITTGIDLTEFDTLIFVGLDWVPSTLMQMEARLHRIGQTKTVNVFYLIGSRTIDEVIQHRVIDRLEHFAAIIGNAPDEQALAADLLGNEDDLIASIIDAVGKLKAP
jgi:superfamily II DNA or RNA helicase